MKTRYLIFFPAGLGGLVVAQLAKDLRNVAVEFRDDSACVVSSTSDSAEVARLLYVKNAFIVQKSVSAPNITAGAQRFVEWLRAGGKVTLDRRRPRGFRVMAHVNGGLQGMPPRSKQALERSLGQATRTRVQARGDGDEYWLVERRDTAVKYLAWRIPRRERKQPSARGSLSPELAYLLVTASDPTGRDVFLDPFAGSGALPLARSHLPAKAIIASDVDTGFELLDRAGAKVTTYQRDFFDEAAFGELAADVIVTDPPWGEHAEIEDGFLDALARRFRALLSAERGARLVVLMTRSRAADLGSALRAAGFTDVRSTEILVNGHPATVLKAVLER